MKGKGGIFDIAIDGRLAFSTHKEGLFPTDEEVDATARS